MAQIWNRTTTSFLDFSRLEHAQATHEHTEQPTTQLGSASFVDAIGFRLQSALSGNLSDDDGDGKDNGKKEIGLISKATTLHAHRAFLNIFVVAGLHRETS